MKDPATFDWTPMSNVGRLTSPKYLTLTDQDNITHPYLVEKWEPSSDLKTWTLYLRKGVQFQMGAKRREFVLGGRRLEASSDGWRRRPARPSAA